MGGHGGPSGYEAKFSAKVPTTKLTGSEKQVSWAEDIRSDMVNTINNFYNAAVAEHQAKANLTGKKKELADKRYKDDVAAAKAMSAQLSEVTSASWFIDNKGLGSTVSATLQSYVENAYNQRSPMLTLGRNLAKQLKDAKG